MISFFPFGRYQTTFFIWTRQSRIYWCVDLYSTLFRGEQRISGLKCRRQISLNIPSSLSFPSSLISSLLLYLSLSLVFYATSLPIVVFLVVRWGSPIGEGGCSLNISWINALQYGNFDLSLRLGNWSRAVMKHIWLHGKIMYGNHRLIVATFSM